MERHGKNMTESDEREGVGEGDDRRIKIARGGER